MFKKQIPTTIGILIIFLLAGIVGASVLFLTQEDEEKVLLRGDIVIEETEEVELDKMTIDELKKEEEEIIETEESIVDEQAITENKEEKRETEESNDYQEKMDKISRNSTRSSHITSIGTAIRMYSLENEGDYHDCISGEDIILPFQKGKGSSAKSCDGFMNYIPKDPLENEEYRIGWYNKEQKRIIIWSTADEALDEEVWEIF